MDCAQDPTLLDWLKVLPVPLAALFGVWIGIQQMITARVKLRLDLYDKRLPIYEEIISFMLIVMSRKMEQEDWDKFKNNTSNAHLLFDDKVINYISEISGKAASIASMRMQLDRGNVSQQVAERYIADNQTWFSMKYNEVRHAFIDAMRVPLVGTPGAWIGRCFDRVTRWAKNQDLRLTNPLIFA